MGDAASENRFSTAASILLGLIAFGHVLRLLLWWDVSINGVPLARGVGSAALLVTAMGALAARQRGVIPLYVFNTYWLGWGVLSVTAVIWNWESLFPFLVGAFLFTETAGILFTVKDAGTLTDTTAKYIPEDATFILLGLILWRVGKWVGTWEFFNWDWTFSVWILAAWLIQHFIVHYLTRALPFESGPTGWLAPRKINRWWRVSVRQTADLRQEERVPPRRRDAVDDDFKRKVLAAVVLLLISLIHLIRLVLQWRVLVNQVEIPVWVSVVMCVVAGGLGVMVWREAKMTRALRKKVAPVA